MSIKTIPMTEALYDYLVRVGVREHPTLKKLRAATVREAGDRAGMQISPDEGALLALLVRLIGARRTIEAGTFTGYSALAVALALPDEGRVVACDVSAEWTGIARKFWQEAGVAHKIDLRLAPALETMDALLAQGGSGTFDFAFLDAVKTEYAEYLEHVVRLLRPGGLLAVDNVLWSGRVADAAVRDTDTRALRSFNTALHQDERFDIAMVPVADGLTLARLRD